MINRIDDQLRVQRLALNGLVQRQEMLASNIANADTPHYKARDIDFKDALATNLAGRQAGSNPGLAVTAPRHMVAAAPSPFAAATKYRSEFQPGVDGNTVVMDIERGAFAENALRIEAALTFVRGEFRDLQAALSQ